MLYLCITRHDSVVKSDLFNPIRSGGGVALKPPPSNFCPHTFIFGATLLCVGTFPKK